MLLTAALLLSAFWLSTNKVLSGPLVISRVKACNGSAPTSLSTTTALALAFPVNGGICQEAGYYAELVQAFRYKLCMSSVDIVRSVRSNCA